MTQSPPLDADTRAALANARLALPVAVVVTATDAVLADATRSWFQGQVDPSTSPLLLAAFTVVYAVPWFLVEALALWTLLASRAGRGGRLHRGLLAAAFALLSFGLSHLGRLEMDPGRPFGAIQILAALLGLLLPWMTVHGARALARRRRARS